MSEYINQIDNEYSTRAQAIEDLEAKLIATKNHHIHNIFNLILGLSPQEQLEAVSHVYWYCQAIHAEDLYPLFDCTTKKTFLKKINPLTLYQKCVVCQQRFSQSFKSRTALISSRWAGYDRHGRLEMRALAATCPSCEKKKWETQNRTQQETIAIQSNMVINLKTMPYSEYLKTDHWITLRKRTMRRAGYRCQLCNSNGTIHVHHKTYERRGEELYDDLIVLCKDCHAKFHDKLPEAL